MSLEKPTTLGFSLFKAADDSKFREKKTFIFVHLKSRDWIRTLNLIYLDLGIFLSNENITLIKLHYFSTVFVDNNLAFPIEQVEHGTEIKQNKRNIEVLVNDHIYQIDSITRDGNVAFLPSQYSCILTSQV